jgi:hypothetical protein
MRRKKMTYRQFREAIDVFGLGDRATLQQIKTRHRELVKTHHPDLSNTENQDAICKINVAHKILIDYCNGYRFCFSEEEFLAQTPTERLKRQFGWDPVWGGRSDREPD